MNNKWFLLFSFLLLLFFAGCISNLQTEVEFEDTGAGSAVITLDSSSDVSEDIKDFFGSKKNVEIVKTESGDSYSFVVSFDIPKATDITPYSEFTISSDATYEEVYVYEDILSFKTLTKESSSVPDFDYCVKMPEGSKVTKLVFDEVEDQTQQNKRRVCVEVDGSSSNIGQTIYVKAVVLRSGCNYDNPPCDSDEDCENNICVLKKGCWYNNPSCDSSHECQANICVLKPGCLYDNPACGEDYRCVGNECVLKPGCQYDNPACGESYNCIDNICVLKEGCAYNNPPCPWYEDCHFAENSCEISFLLFGSVLIIVIVGVLIWNSLFRTKDIKKKKQDNVHKKVK